MGDRSEGLQAKNLEAKKKPDLDGRRKKLDVLPTVRERARDISREFKERDLDRNPKSLGGRSIITPTNKEYDDYLNKLVTEKKLQFGTRLLSFLIMFNATKMPLIKEFQNDIEGGSLA